jgi:hypothetical protein
MASNSKIIDESERILKEAAILLWRYYPSICLQGVRKAMKNTSEYNQGHNLDLKPAPSEY